MSFTFILLPSFAGEENEERSICEDSEREVMASGARPQ
jgi:hypothetical protein